ncbi:MAG: AbrB/MazE/SpoVT family DNA-binding domain-containing protein [Patescibacteria group bacterium]|nr:AbrB/MazE/SpoVT family DNA-binding domain-containing protein [Patescibacteria group bacterium]MCL5432135.1 AbrB/MazE/SpoVT family DNA-binding domain-containing protein [Patescibacteria group bacterium]
MTTVTTLTSKGQVTIPAYLREELQLTARQKISFSSVPGGILLKKAASFFDLGGSVKTAKKFDIRTMDKTAKKLVSSRYAKSY